MSAITPPWAILVDPDSATPVYVQVAQGLAHHIHSGDLPRGSALPAERDLASRLNISRVTVRQALSLLAQQGLLSRRHGSGTYVTPPVQPGEVPSRPLGLLSSFSDDVRSRGQTPGAQVLSFERSRPTPNEAMSLALSPGDTVYRIRRLRTADGEPLAVEDSTLPQALVGKLTRKEVTNASLYALLQERGVQLHRAIRHLRAVNATLTLASLLDVHVGAALLATDRVSWTPGGQAVEYARAHYRGDRYDFVMELQGDGA